MSWHYKGEIIDKIDVDEFPTFVYVITNLIDGRFYIGYKQTTFSKIKQVKGKKKKHRVDSDWLTYWSSSVELNADLATLGEHNFKREILYLCKSKSMGRYLELREQIDRRVMENPSLTYNGIVNARISRMHLKNVLKYIEEATQKS